MQGNPDVLAKLQLLLANELSAIDQYFIHSRIYEDMGLHVLAERIEHEREEETQHADAIIKRMLFLGGRPDLSQRDGLNVGDSVPAMLKSDLGIEYAVDKGLKEAIALCESTQDFQTRQVLLQLLEDTEEDHIYWLEQQLRLIETIGLENYLQSKLGSESSNG